MEILTITAKSFTLIDKAKTLVKSRQDYFVSLTLLNPRADGKNIEVIVPIKNIAAGEKNNFEGLEGYQKEMIRSFLIPGTHLIAQFFAVKNSSKFMEQLKKAVSAGAVAGVGLITGNPLLAIGTAFVSEATKSAVDLLPSKKKVNPLGKAFMSYQMMKTSLNGVIHLQALDKVLVETLTEVNPETGEIRKIKRYLPGGFGIAEFDVKFQFTGGIAA
jgi:hypothetical protein